MFAISEEIKRGYVTRPRLIMSETFTLTGTGSYLSTNYYPPVALNADYEYTLGLIGYWTYNALRNIYPGNNKIYWRKPGDKKNRQLLIAEGAYEINSLNEYISKKLALTNNETLKQEEIFSLQPNTNTLKCEIKSKYAIDFRPDDSIGRMLGFSPKVLEADVLHESDLPVKISPASSIRINCNITGGAHYNDTPVHTIYEFALDVEPGEQVNEKPTNVIYLPVVVADQIDNITLSLTNQNGERLNFGHEDATIRLELKKKEREKKWG